MGSRLWGFESPLSHHMIVAPASLSSLQSRLLCFTVLSLALVSCRNEGEVLVDRMAGILEQAVDRLETPLPEGESGEKAALEYLESKAVEMRQIESRLDDVVRTLKGEKKLQLVQYARQRLEELENKLEPHLEASP